jgi:tRNA(His) guanylyltransferase
MKDDLGDRMKGYESTEAKRRLSVGPVCARIDGRSFSAFTRGFNRPYDARIARAMKHACMTLVEDTHASIGFVQSDEISLIWDEATEESQMIFDGRIQKLCSVLASLATISFGLTLSNDSPDSVRDKLPHFDARVWSVPTRSEAANTILWRAQDARRNGISSAARAYMSANQMHGLSQSQMVEAIAAKGINYDTTFPIHHRFGTYYQRKTAQRVLTNDERMAIPADHRPTPDALYTRSSTYELGIQYFGDVENRMGVIFDQADPVLLGAD